MSLPAGLPTPVARWLSLVGEETRTGDVSASGTGTIHQAVAGRMGIRLPLTWDLRLRPGRFFTWEAVIRAFGIRKVRSAEEYLSSRGRLIAGHRVYESEQIDRAQYAFLWAWTLALAPALAARESSVGWEAGDRSSARILFPYESEVLEATLRFDEGSGFLRRFETRRFELRAGYPRLWSAAFTEHREIGGITIPTSIVTAWEDEPVIRLEVERIERPG